MAYGRMLPVSALVGCLEVALTVVVVLLYARTQPPPDTPVDHAALAAALFSFGLLVCVIAFLLSLVFVLPAVALADPLGRRIGGREAWWWVPCRPWRPWWRRRSPSSPRTTVWRRGPCSSSGRWPRPRSRRAVTATGIGEHDPEDHPAGPSRQCTGSGAWSYEPGRGVMAPPSTAASPSRLSGSGAGRNLGSARR